MAPFVFGVQGKGDDPEAHSEGVRGSLLQVPPSKRAFTRQMIKHTCTRTRGTVQQCA
jgi:hypothetical protein